MTEWLSHWIHSYNHKRGTVFYRTGKSNEKLSDTLLRKNKNRRRWQYQCEEGPRSQAVLWSSRCPVRRLVPSEWARSVSGFWTHSSFKCCATLPHTIAIATVESNPPQKTWCMLKNVKNYNQNTVLKKVFKKKEEEKNESAWRHDTSDSR